MKNIKSYVFWKPISTPISTKEKEWGHEKNRRPTPGPTKSKQKKTGGKLKENKIIK